VVTRSLHHIAHPGLRDAIDRYLEAEREAVESEAEALLDMTPFKKSG